MIRTTATEQWIPSLFVYMCKYRNIQKDFDVKKLERKLKSIVKDQETVEDLLENNFDKVINDLDIGIRR